MFRMNPRDLSVYTAKRTLLLAAYLFTCVNAQQNETQPEVADTQAQTQSPTPAAATPGTGIMDLDINIKTALLVSAATLSVGLGVGIALACACLRNCCNKKQDDDDLESQTLLRARTNRDSRYARLGNKL